MRYIVGLLKLLLLSAVAAVAMGVVGLLVAVIVTPLFNSGENPHTDYYAQLGMVMIGTIVGAALGVIGVWTWTIRRWIKERRPSLENPE